MQGGLVLDLARAHRMIIVRLLHCKYREHVFVLLLCFLCR